ncbi:exonuclease domain-containing protein [Phenylobacterium sp.]|uniref:exonuclease domain-containing protein n=1 Tax=Phenylobacterium sp. TaxID=1871053 RepID=UPI0035B26821
MSFVFYDTETTGTHSAFDQILQFAAIRTDDGLQEIDRFEIRSRLLPYVVPSPGALRVTGLTIDQLLDEALPSHYEMVTQMRRVLGAWCPAAFVGYNSLRFDEEFLRQAFYQCLHPPYLTNTGGSRRADALHLVRAAAVLHPDRIVVAKNDKGGPSFKLDRLAPANGYNHPNAHEAMADVEALIFLCRLVRDRCPELWARFLRFADKSAVTSFIDDEDAFLLMEFYPAKTGEYVVTALGRNPSQPNIVYVYDLSVDPAELRDLGEAELAARLARRPKPIRKVRLNAGPCLCPLSEASQDLLGSDTPDEYARRAREVRSDFALMDRLVAAATAVEPVYPPSPHVERRIYDGFWSSADARKLEAFHVASWADRVAIADGLDDERLAWLARRLIFVEQPNHLPPERHAAMADEIAKRLLADAFDCGGWTTLAVASESLATMLPELDPATEADFRRLGGYLEKLVGDARRCTGVFPFRSSGTVGNLHT